MQDCSNSSALAMELLQSCTKPLIYIFPSYFSQQTYNPSGAVAEIFWDNYVNNMVTDDLAPCITWPSVAMVLTMQDKSAIVFSAKNIYLPHVPSHCRQMIENANTSSMFSQKKSACERLKKENTHDSGSIYMQCTEIWLITSGAGLEE